MTEQMNIFECLYQSFKTNKKLRLIELFAGYGSQALALKYLGVPFEHWKICEWNYKSFQAYKDIHMPDDDTDYSASLTKEQLADYLIEKGISSNWNAPMKAEQIKRLNESKLREIYNNIQSTHNLVDVSKIHANDLQITNRDKYTYILTYSFPCQDLSLAGLRGGMNRDSETRSSLLWEVERILQECAELNCLPDILLMENVPQVHGTDNMPNFREWLTELERLGYQSYWQDLIATDYGIPQIRNRTFCLSLLGEYSYSFPQPIELEKRLKDMLEDKVDEKYYLSDKAIKGFTAWEQRQKENGNGFAWDIVDVEREREKRQDHKQYAEARKHSPTMLTEGTDTARTVTAVYGKQRHWEQYIDETDRGQEIYEIKPPHGYFPGTFRKADKIAPIDTGTGSKWHTVLGEREIKTVGNYSPSGHNATRIVDPDGVPPTVMENHGQVTAITEDDKD